MKFFVRYSPHQDEVETFLLKQKIIVYIIIYKKKVTSLCDPILRCVNTSLFTWQLWKRSYYLNKTGTKPELWFFEDSNPANSASEIRYVEYL